MATPRKKPAANKKPAVKKLVRDNGSWIKQGCNWGNKGSGGRPPDQFKAAMRELASGDETLKFLAAILRKPNHPHYMQALKFVSEQGYGKATQPIDLNIENGAMKGYIERDESGEARLMNLNEILP